MAGTKGDDGAIEPEDFVERIVGDPNYLPNAKTIPGLVGKSPVEGCIRIYTDANFNAFIEVALDDVLAQQPFPEERSSLGGSFVSIRRDAEVSVTRAHTQTISAEFLRGPVAGGFRASVIPALRTEAMVDADTGWVCWSGEQWLWCTSNWYKDCTNSTFRRTKVHVTEDTRCKDGCWFTL